MAAKSPSTTVSGPSEADQAAVAAIPQHVVAAWADHDADAFAGAFTEDGTLILPGLFLKGREEIRSHMAADWPKLRRQRSKSGSFSKQIHSMSEWSERIKSTGLRSMTISFVSGSSRATLGRELPSLALSICEVGS